MNFLLAMTVAIVLETDMGNIEAVLDDKRAPTTVANFLKYVDAGQFNGGQFHRTVRTQPDNQPQSKVKIDVIQASVNAAQEKNSFGNIALERTRDTGLRHSDGALSMARGVGADSGSSSFFICIGEQNSLDFGGMRNPDGQGFAVFGKVTKGMDVVRRIHRAPSGPNDSREAVAQGDQKLTPPIRIVRIRRK